MKNLIIIAGFLLFSLCSCAIFRPSPQKCLTENKINAPYDAIIVPGVPFDGETWSETMHARVLWSKYLFDNGYTKNIIYSGSAVYTEYEEAAIMAKYAEAMGIPKEHIYTDPRAEHSTENIYYSYQVAKKNNFKTLALATDPFQANSMRTFVKKFDFPIDFLPIVFDTLKMQDQTTPKIDPTTAKVEHFVSIKERESFGKRLKGTMGQNICWQEEDLKTKRLYRKYKDRLDFQVEEN